MRSRVVLSALVVIGSFALCATAAQAGGGQGTPAALNVFFDCQSIDGANVDQVVSTYLAGTDTVLHENVRVGAGILKCQQVDVKNSAGVFINGDISNTELKCYSVSVKGPKAASETFVFQDDFFAAETVKVSPAAQLLCGPTLLTTP
jgi:hypothetical protein